MLIMMSQEICFGIAFWSESGSSKQLTTAADVHTGFLSDTGQVLVWEGRSYDKIRKIKSITSKRRNLRINSTKLMWMNDEY